MANQYTPSSEPLGSFKANVHYTMYLGQQTQMVHRLIKGLAGPMPTGRDPTAGKVQSDPGMPIVQCWDLRKMKGDRVNVDMKGRFSAKPIMNDRDQLERKEALAYKRDEVTLSLYTHTGDPGGIMTRQRNAHDTRMDVMEASVDWAINLEDNLFMVHAYGARGSQTGEQWVIPLESDPDYQDIVGNHADDDGTRVGNPVLPPSRSRYFLPNDATGLDNMDTSDTISLAFLTRIRARLNLSAVPLRPISAAALSIGSVPKGANTNLLIGFLSEEQYLTIKETTGAGSFTQMVIDANTRVDFNSHPAFADVERFMWCGVVWLKSPRTIEFAAGSSVQQYDPVTGALETVTVAVRAHRGIIMGAQAIGELFGNANPPPADSGGGMSGSGSTPFLKTPYSWREDIRVGGSVLDIFVRLMKGVKKFRYTWNGVVYDNGIAAFDTYQASLG